MSRTLSNNTEYPFIPGTIDVVLDKVVEGLLDIYIVIRGSETGDGLPAQAYPTISLVDVSTTGSSMILSFRAVEIDGRYWDFTADLANADVSGEILLVNACSLPDIAFSLFYDTSVTSTTFSDISGASAEVESSRTLWHTERLETLDFTNIARCNSVEDPGSVSTEYSLDMTAATAELTLGDGYSTEWSYVDNALTLVGEAGIGEGYAPDYGNEGQVGSSSCALVDVGALDGVYTINGVLPTNGNIDLLTSSALYLNKSIGVIEVSKRLET
jgi:hypothetical protein